MYHRDAPTDPDLIDDWDRGIGWIAHPGEGGRRASHAFRFDDGVWVVDPIDVPGIGDHLEAYGDIVGIAVCSSWHARDASVFARRYDLPVTVPAGMSRVESRIDAPIERYRGDLDGAGVAVIHRQSIPRLEEAILYHRSTRTLYVPDCLGTTEHHTIPGERLGLTAFYRLSPPTALRGLEPARICCGHGSGIFDAPTDALETALRAPRRTFPRAVAQNWPATFRSVLGALRG